MPRVGLVAGGASLAFGVLVGVVAESHTNEVAGGKASTAETCLEIHGGVDGKIGEDLDDCMADGVPGGRAIGTDKFDPDDPVVFVDAYIQRHEARQIEMGRLVIWSIVPDAIAVAVIVSS